MKFWIVWGIDAVVALVFACFFVIGLADGSVSSFNMTLWLLILGVLCGILWGSHALRAAGRTGLATSLAMILAVPGVLAGVFFLALVILNPRWN